MCHKSAQVLERYSRGDTRPWGGRDSCRRSLQWPCHHDCQAESDYRLPTSLAAGYELQLSRAELRLDQAELLLRPPLPACRRSPSQSPGVCATHRQIEFLLLAIIGYYCDAIIANNSD